MLTQSDLKAKRELVVRVVASSGMSRSTRLRELFLYLCSCVLDDGVKDIHELEVGHKVFGRSAHYDTIADNIVRVHASMLRKRLNEFFETDGQNESFTIEIPKGNYAPLFIERPISRRRHSGIETPAVEPFTLGSASSHKDASLPADAHAAAPSRSSASALRVVSLLAILFCGLSIFLYLSGRHQRGYSHHEAVTGQPTVRQFWVGLFPESSPTVIVLDDASLDIYQEMTGNPVTLAEYFDRSYMASVEKSAAASRMDPAIIHSLMLSRQSSFSNSGLIWKMAQIAGELHSSASVQFARDLTFRQVKASNVILLGNARSNPWIQPFDSRLSLVWVIDPVLHTYYPRDKTAPASAQDQFRTSAEEGNAHVGYATISFLPNLNGSGNILILSATGGSTMGVALDFLCDETSMSQLRARLPQSHTSAYPYFDALIKTGKGSKELSSVKVVICRSSAFPAASNP